MGIIMGFCMTAGFIGGLTISVALGGLEIYSSRRTSTLRGETLPGVFIITMAMVLPALVIGVYLYPSGLFNSHVDMVKNNFCNGLKT